MAEKKEAESKAANPDAAKQKEAAKSKEPEKKAAKPDAAKQKEAAKSKEPAEGDKEKPEVKKDEKVEEESFLKDLMAISGHGGLFRFVSQGRNGVIVESIETGKRMQAFASMKVSALEDIAVYTEDEEIQLEEVFAALHKYENGKEAISPKSEPDDLKDYFSAVLPAYDRERVYVSDIKKMLGWYNLLLKHGLMEPGKSRKKAEDKSQPETEKTGDTKAGDKKSGTPKATAKK